MTDLSPDDIAEIKAFVKERDEMLMVGTVEAMVAFHRKHNPNVPIPSPQIAEMSIHKARTAAKSLPIEARLESKRWLSERGFTSRDDGDLLQ